MTSNLTKYLKADSEKNSSALKLTEVYHCLLREHHVLSDIKQAYQTIEVSKAKSLLGFGAETSDQHFSDYMSHRGFNVEGPFIVVPSNIDSKREDGQ